MKFSVMVLLIMLMLPTTGLMPSVLKVFMLPSPAIIIQSVLVDPLSTIKVAILKILVRLPRLFCYHSNLSVLICRMCAGRNFVYNDAKIIVSLQ